MSDDDAREVEALESALTEWIGGRPATVECAVIALGIAAARLIHGVGVMQGAQAGVDAAALLDQTVARSLRMFRNARSRRTLH